MAVAEAIAEAVTEVVAIAAVAVVAVATSMIAVVVLLVETVAAEVVAVATSLIAVVALLEEEACLFAVGRLAAMLPVVSGEVDHHRCLLEYTCKFSPEWPQATTHMWRTNTDAAMAYSPPLRTKGSQSSKTTGLQAPNHSPSAICLDAGVMVQMGNRSHSEPITSRFNLPTIPGTRSSTNPCTDTRWLLPTNRRQS